MLVVLENMTGVAYLGFIRLVWAELWPRNEGVREKGVICGVTTEIKLWLEAGQMLGCFFSPTSSKEIQNVCCFYLCQLTSWSSKSNTAPTPSGWWHNHYSALFSESGFAVSSWGGSKYSLILYCILLNVSISTSHMKAVDLIVYC